MLDLDLTFNPCHNTTLQDDAITQHFIGNLFFISCLKNKLFYLFSRMYFLLLSSNINQVCDFKFMMATASLTLAQREYGFSQPDMEAEKASIELHLQLVWS